MRIRATIIGGTGYTAGELLGLLLNHPQVEVVQMTSTSHAGEPVAAYHREYLGECALRFTDEGQLLPCDVLFLCLGHGLSRAFLENHALDPATKVIDLGNDFRLTAPLAGSALPGNVCGKRVFDYGLPEATGSGQSGSGCSGSVASCPYPHGNVANPGCFATAIQLALLPLAAAGLLTREVHVHAITGASGGGRKLAETAHFPWRNNNISVYKVFNHQHLGEIHQTLEALSGSRRDLHFVPLRGDFSRGIFASLYTRCPLTTEEARDLYRKYYAPHPFVHLSEKSPALKEVVNTNKCLLYVEQKGGFLYLNSIIDNLVKGASGQAVQNMNLLFDLPQDLGLHLKPIRY